MQDYVTSNLENLSDTELEALFKQPVDLNILLEAISDLPFNQRMDVYQFLEELTALDARSNSLQYFATTMLDKMKKEIDDFCAAYTFEKITLKEFLQNGIELQKNSQYQTDESAKKEIPAISLTNKSSSNSPNKETSMSKELCRKSSSKSSKSPLVKAETKKSVGSLQRSDETLKKVQPIIGANKTKTKNAGKTLHRVRRIPSKNFLLKKDNSTPTVGKRENVIKPSESTLSSNSFTARTKNSKK